MRGGEGKGERQQRKSAKTKWRSEGWEECRGRERRRGGTFIMATQHLHYQQKATLTVYCLYTQAYQEVRCSAYSKEKAVVRPKSTMPCKMQHKNIDNSFVTDEDPRGRNVLLEPSI